MCVVRWGLCVGRQGLATEFQRDFLCFLAANLQNLRLFRVHIRRQDFGGLWLADENFPIKNFARKILVRQSQFRIWRELAGSNKWRSIYELLASTADEFLFA